MSSAKPHSPPPPPPPFQFRLRTLLLLFVVLGSSLGVFGGWGIVVFGLAVGFAIYIARAKTFKVSLLAVPLIIAAVDAFGVFLGRVMPAIAAARQQGWWPYWPNLAALAVWLLSVGVLLTHAVRSRKAPSVPPPPAC